MMRLRKVKNGKGKKKVCWVVEGRITGEHASLMAREYFALSTTARASLRVDVKAVSFVDQRGLELLCRMKKDHVTLVGGGQLIQVLIDRFCHPGKRWTIST